MSKRAQYTGTAPVKVVWPPGAVDADVEHEEWIEPQHWLSDEAPAAMRDSLLKEHPELFTEREQPTAKSPAKED